MRKGLNIPMINLRYCASPSAQGEIRLSDEINSHPSKKNSWSIGKHLMMATLTGGLSLIFVLGLRLPALWESVCLVHAEWIQKGRDPGAGLGLAGLQLGALCWSSFRPP
jgi:hypothetical protein